ncbi:unnamed protein product [Blepharisma stoltei]|uniref:Uncharacterized protein n=1 Tax=Blepharisma stoltei TaxID=1481888 RepID=A0AAU9IGV7_9CILI|nr:unnamed protein product [Blepharisma stoltei]
MGDTEIMLFQNEELRYENSQVSFDIIDSSGTKMHNGLGKFCITTQRVYFSNSQGVWEKALEEIGVHAISRDPRNFGAPCLYCQLLAEDICQWIFIPQDQNELKPMFGIFTQCVSNAPCESSHMEEDL